MNKKEEVTPILGIRVKSLVLYYLSLWPSGTTLPAVQVYVATFFLDYYKHVHQIATPCK